MQSPRVLTLAEVGELLVRFPRWHVDSRGFLCCRLNTPHASQLLRDIIDIADGANHHPFVRWSFQTLELELTTHDVGALSERDRGFVEAFESLDSLYEPEE